MKNIDCVEYTHDYSHIIEDLILCPCGVEIPRRIAVEYKVIYNNSTDLIYLICPKCAIEKGLIKA